MVTCAKCGTIVFIDMDGVAHLGSEPASEEPIAIEPFGLEAGADIQGSTLSSLDQPIEQSTASSSPETSQETSHDSLPVASEYSFDPPPFEELPSDPAPIPIEPMAEPEEQPSAEAPPEEELNMDAILGYQEPTPAESLGGGGSAGEFGTPGDPLGINEFANSEISQAGDGMLVFRLAVSGIDSKEIRESLREALEDARFAWDVPGLMSQINKGRLQIDSVSPVKATILINRIKRLPVEIRWEQNAITQIDDSESNI